MADKPEDKGEIEGELLKIMAMKQKTAQEKFNAVAELAKKYGIPVEKMMKNIIMEWMNEDKEKKFNTFKPKGKDK